MKKTIEKNIVEWASSYIGEDFEFREHQLESIVDIIYNVLDKNAESKTHIIEAPTGAGKSLMLIISAGVLSTYYKKTSYILCSDLFLWQQYNDFIMKHNKVKDMFGCLKGQTGNYICNRNKEDIRNAECRIANIPWQNLYNKEDCKKMKFECARKCKYVKARRHAQRSPVTMMTYQLYFYMINIVGNQMDNPPFKERDVIFCDECHNIPSMISAQYTPIVRLDLLDHFSAIYDYNMDMFTGIFAEQNDISRITDFWPTKKEMMDDFTSRFFEMVNNKDNDYNEIMSYIHEFVKPFAETVEKMEENAAVLMKSQARASKTVLETYKTASWYHNYCCFLNDFNKAVNDCGKEYVIKSVKVKNDTKEFTVSYKCAKEDYMCYKYLLSTSENQVLTSATIGLKESFCDNIGMKYMNNTEPKIDKIKSTFDFSQSPIYYYPRFKMSYSEKEVSFPELKKITYSVIEKFKNYRGIIQTGSYENALSLYRDAPYSIKSRLLLYNNSSEKTVTIDAHKLSSNSVIIGPTLNEGIDLPDDMCRFIIILKVPYPSLNDELVKAKRKLFPYWYDSETSNSIIQGIGRGNRHKDDWCVTYILDGCFGQLYGKTKNQFSPELRERIKQI